MEKLYNIEYKGGNLYYSSERPPVFIAISEEAALEQFTHWARERSVNIENTPVARQTYLETYQHTPNGAYGPRPRYPEENDVLISKPTVGCCEYMATGCCGHVEPSGKPVSEPGSEPAE